MKLSVVIPARDEAGGIAATVDGLVSELARAAADFEIVVVDDGSTDGTAQAVRALGELDARVRCVRNDGPPGFGYAVRRGLQEYTGDAVTIVMADGAEDPRDVVRYLRVLEAGRDCAFGSRFVAGGSVHDYPLPKLVLNRLFNTGIRLLFGLRYDDVTNAFKAYRREVVDNAMPLLSAHFNLCVELPLKAITRGFDYEVIPVSWRNRRSGRSKLKIEEMGSRYVFILLYVFLEKHLSRGDYRPAVTEPDAERAERAALR